MSKCFADIGTICTALKVKECKGCHFFKTQEQIDYENERTKKRLSYLKSVSINICK